MPSPKQIVPLLAAVHVRPAILTGVILQAVLPNMTRQ
jgi:hypothetical protein